MPGEPPFDDLLRTFLADRDVVCPVCRYNLRGCGGPRCPECGARLDLRVGSIDLRLGPYLSCVLAIAVPLGFIGILAIIAAIGYLGSSFWSSRDWTILVVLWVGSLVHLGALLWVIHKRVSIQRLPGAKQWRLVAIVAVVELFLVWWLLWFM